MTADLEMGWMHIELNLEELPKVGEIIILNDGSSYYVTNVMWWVDGPQNEAYWARGDYRTDEGRFQTVNISVEPDNRRERYGYPAGIEDGKIQGADEFIVQLREQVNLLNHATSGQAGVAMGLIEAWLIQREVAMQERIAEKAKQDAIAAEVITRMFRENERRLFRRSLNL